MVISDTEVITHGSKQYKSIKTLHQYSFIAAKPFFLSYLLTK